MVQVGSAQLPVNGYQFRSSPVDGQEVVLGIRPEHVHVTDEGTIEAETLFVEPMGADTLGWFQFGEHRLSARLVPQLARGLSGRVKLHLHAEHMSLFDPSTEARL
jgi:multiple sugar transport system ATP-binding protein